MAYKTVILDGMATSQVVTNASDTLPGLLGNVSASAFTVAADSTARLFVFGDNQQSTNGLEVVLADAGGNAYEITDGDQRVLHLTAAQTVAKNDPLYITTGGYVSKSVTAGGLVAWADEDVTTTGATSPIAVVMA